MKERDVNLSIKARRIKRTIAKKLESAQAATASFTPVCDKAAFLATDVIAKKRYLHNAVYGVTRIVPIT